VHCSLLEVSTNIASTVNSPALQAIAYVRITDDIALVC
jgi:hypothetical protein